VNVTDALRGVRRIFLDTAPVIYLIEANEQYLTVLEPVFAGLDAGEFQAITSPITLSECLIVPLRRGDERLQALFTQVATQRATCVWIDPPIARSAARLRVRYNVSLLDAFQIAAALSAECDAFLTNDVDLKRVRELRVIVVQELQRPAAIQ
jgi:predicted nucleic acid-binding protein